MDWSLDHRLALLGNEIGMREFIAKEHGRWLQRELVATDASRSRLLAWALSGGLKRPAPDVHALKCKGDINIRVAAILALTKLAPPARDYVLEKAFVVCCGADSSGFVSDFPPLPCESGARLVALSLGAPEGNPGRTALAVRAALHEFAHVWLEPDDTFGPPGDAEMEERRNLLQAIAAGSPVRYTKKQTPVELRAWALAERWEGETFGGDFWREVRSMLTIERQP